jgi:eukaryotic-like serine/threonine-protein kinase
VYKKDFAVPEPQPFGKYTLLRKIAEGGMAEIFLALQAGPGGFGKLLVIKKIKQAHNQEKDFIAMFLDEARIAASLSHPNIAQIFEVGEVDALHYIAMEFVHGEDLRSLCRKLAKAKRPLPLAHAISMMAGACAGLHYAHTKTDFSGNPLEIVHRDVSPQNLLISYDGHVKLVDFGIAKAAGRSQETRVGVLKGKISYMSPEQVSGGALDSRSDIFPIGILLYELTTGRRLYKDESDFKTMRKITDEDVVPPREMLPGYPERLEEIVMKALEKKPADRYQSGQELQSDLEHFARQEGLDISNLALATFMRDVFSDKLAEQAREESQGKPLHQILAERGATESIVGDPASSSMARGEVNSAFLIRKKSRPWLPIAGAGAVVFFAAAAIVAYPLLTQPQAPSTTPSTATSLPLAMKTLVIQSDPVGAEVFEKGSLLGVTPLTLTVKEGDKLHLRFQTPNFEPERREETIDANTSALFVSFTTPLKKATPTTVPSPDPNKNNTNKNPVGKTPKKTPNNNPPPDNSGPGKFIDPFLSETPKK